MQNTTIRIIFVLYTYCILIFLCRVYVHYFLTLCTNATFWMLQRNVCNTRWTFTIKSDLNILLLPTTASVVLVRSVRWLSNVPLRWVQYEEGGQHLCRLRRSWERVFVSSYYLTSHWRPAFSARTHHTADMSFKVTFDNKGWWVKWLQVAESWLTLLILQPPVVKTLHLVFHPIRNGKVLVQRHLNAVLWSETMNMRHGLNRQTRININALDFPGLAGTIKTQRN